MKTMLRHRFCLALFGLSGLATLFAQPVTNFQVKHFTTAHGLIHNNVYSIFQDNAHDIWFGTEGGLTRFQGWLSYTTRNSKLSANRVNTLFQDSYGNLWVGTTQGLSIWLSYNASWQNLTHTQFPFIADHITVIFRDQYNHLWIGTRGGGILQYRGDFGIRVDTGLDAWSMYDTGNADLVSDDITALNTDHWGQLWVGSENFGLCKFDGQATWTSLRQNETVYGNKIHIIFRDQTDTLWIGTNLGVFKTFDGTAWQKIEKVPATQAIETDLSGNLWFGTNQQGLFRYDHRQVQPVTHDSLNPNAAWQAIYRDDDGNLWLATNGDGVYRLELNWQIFNTQNSQLKDNYLTAVTIDSNGIPWFGTDLHHLAQYVEGSFSQVRIGSEKIGMEHVNALLVDQSNQLWCATNDGVHCYLQSKSWQSYLPKNVVQSILQDPLGDFWFGTDQAGLSLFEANYKSTLTTKDRLPSNNITCFLTDAKGRVWLGTDQGVVVLKDQAIQVMYDTNKGLVSNQITAMVQDQNRNIWIGTTNGLSCLDQKNIWQTYQTINSGLINNWVQCLYVDRNHHLWIGTKGGLDRFDGFAWWNYNVYLSPGSGRENISAMTQDTKGNFWLATHGGAIYFMPFVDRIPPETRFIDTPPPIIGVSSHTFFYEGYDRETPIEKLVYAWCLIPNAAAVIPLQWGAYSTQKYHTCDSLENGTYTLYVKTRDQAGNDDPSPAHHTFEVDVTPPTTIILSPTKNEFVPQIIPVIGTVYDDSPRQDFLRYWFEYGRGNSIQHVKQWKLMPGGETPDTNRTLLIWKPDSLGDYFLKLCAEDRLGHESNYAVHVTIVEVLETILPNTGGLVQLTDQRLQLYVPPGAVTEKVQIYGSPLDTSQVSETLPPNLQLSAFAFELGPQTLRFQKPATLTLCYTDDDILNLNAAELAVFSEQEHQVLGGLVHARRHRLQTTIRTLGRFWLGATTDIQVTPPPQIKSSLFELHCQPRVFSPRGSGFAATTTISFVLTVNAEVTIKIYNLAGRLIQKIIDQEPLRSGYNAVEWDGRDCQGEFCPSDLYVVTLQCPQAHLTKTVMILDKSGH